MALTLGDVEPKKKKTKKTAKKKVAKKKASKKASPKSKKIVKTRPWQSPELEFSETTTKASESIEVVTEASERAAKVAIEGFEKISVSEADLKASSENSEDPIKTREQRRKQLQEELIKEWLLVAQQLKNQGIQSLPEPVSSLVKGSWFGKVELAPRVRIPIPEFFVSKSRD